MTSGASLAIRKLSKSFGAPKPALSDVTIVGDKVMQADGRIAPGIDAREARGMIEFALGGARGKNFVNPAPLLDETIA